MPQRGSLETQCTASRQDSIHDDVAVSSPVLPVVQLLIHECPTQQEVCEVQSSEEESHCSLSILVLLRLSSRGLLCCSLSQ